jgi:hypothetical protein
MQLCRIIYCSLAALHVSSDIFAHHQKHLNCESVEITNKMQPCNRIYYSKVYWRLKMFRAAHRSSSGWVPTQPGQRPVTTCVYKPKNANTVWSSWWWVVCRSKHVEPSINFGITNSITRFASCWLFLLINTAMHGSRNIKKNHKLYLQPLVLCTWVVAGRVKHQRL